MASSAGASLEGRSFTKKQIEAGLVCPICLERCRECMQTADPNATVHSRPAQPCSCTKTAHTHCRNEKCHMVFTRKASARRHSHSDTCPDSGKRTRGQETEDSAEPSEEHASLAGAVLSQTKKRRTIQSCLYDPNFGVLRRQIAPEVLQLPALPAAAANGSPPPAQSFTPSDRPWNSMEASDRMGKVEHQAYVGPPLAPAAEQDSSASIAIREGDGLVQAAEASDSTQSALPAGSSGQGVMHDADLGCDNYALPSGIARLLQQRCAPDYISSTSLHLWSSTTKSSRDPMFRSADVIVSQSIEANATVASKILQAQSVESAVQHLAEAELAQLQASQVPTAASRSRHRPAGHVCGGSEIIPQADTPAVRSGSASVQPSLPIVVSSAAAGPSVQQEQRPRRSIGADTDKASVGHFMTLPGISAIFPTRPSALAGRVALMRALQLSSPASVDGPTLPALVDRFMNAVTSSHALERNKLPSVGDSVLVYHDSELVKFSLAFVLPRDAAVLQALPPSKQDLLSDNSYIPVVWCLNAGDSDQSAGFESLPLGLKQLLQRERAGDSRDASAMETGSAQTEHPPQPVPGSGYHHVYTPNSVDVLHCDNVVATGQLAVVDASLTCRFKRPVFTHVDRETSPEDVLRRDYVPIVTSTSSQMQASVSPSSVQASNDVDLSASQLQQALAAQTTLTRLLRRRFTHLPQDGIQEIVVVARDYHISESESVHGFAAAQLQVPTGRCNCAEKSTNSDAACRWTNGELRTRQSVISAQLGVVPVAFRQYRCSAHSGSFEVGTREFFQQFSTLYPDAKPGSQLTVPFIPITRKIRMDDGAAQHLWGLYCRQHKEGLASITRSFTTWITQRLLHRLNSVDAIQTTRVFMEKVLIDLPFLSHGWLDWIRRSALRALFDESAELVHEVASVHRVDAAIMQLHHSIISRRMSLYWQAMARLSSCLAVDFTFKTAARFSVSRVEKRGNRSQTVVYKVHASLSTIVGQHGFFVAGQIGGGHESATRVFGPVSEVLQLRQARARELGSSATPVAAIAVDNPASTNNTLRLAIESVWPAAVHQDREAVPQIHMDHFHFVQRVRSVAQRVHLPDTSLFVSVWGSFTVWLMKPTIEHRKCHQAGWPSAQFVASAIDAQIGLAASVLREAHRRQNHDQDRQEVSESNGELATIASSPASGCLDCHATVGVTSDLGAEPGASQMNQMVNDACCLQEAISAWLQYGSIPGELRLASQRCLEQIGWGLVVPLCAAQQGEQQIWRPLVCKLYNRQIDVPVTVIFAVARSLGLMGGAALHSAGVEASTAASSPSATVSGMQDGVFEDDEAACQQNLDGSTLVEEPTHCPAGAAGHDQNAPRVASIDQASGESSAVAPAFQEIGPISAEKAQDEIWRLVSLFSFVLRVHSAASVEGLIVQLADMFQKSMPVHPGTSAFTANGKNYCPQAEEEAQVPEMPGSQKRTQDEVQHSTITAAAAQQSIMASSLIVKQVLACARNSTALNGMLAQQGFPMNFGGTNHAEAAHSNLSSALGPGSFLNIDKAQQRLELYALLYNSKKAQRLLASDSNRRRLEQQSVIDEYDRLISCSFDHACSIGAHPLCTGPIFSAVLAGPAFQLRTVEQLEAAGITLDARDAPDLSPHQADAIAADIAEAIQDTATKSGKFNLKSLASRLRSKHGLAGLTTAQIKQLAVQAKLLLEQTQNTPEAQP